ncbi:S49 family peptidase [Sinorhizobium meliloti]|uniref:S49 family peptidase n=1 Tax=Rhizobium meliloti TaxID=382 RepID=UPI000FD79237|nr:S49 family peptidase [Sinorhizobium meliloti]MCO6425443.1 S49 family peptidase [Sinorhizobium meliloti]RVM17660.1 S49 family peptidase [Sinorhizobium meliloti]RVO20514.1 S49 family peptidase [Sinorhizobium meliloti]
MTHYPQIAAQLFNRPLLAHRGTLEQYARAMAPRIFGGPVTFGGEWQAGLVGEPIRNEVDWEGNPTYTGPRMIGKTGVAVIEAEGALVPKGKWIGAMCDATSYEGIHAQVSDCRASKDIRGVILEVDSFGGAVAGAFSCADAIHQLAQEKPVLAVLTEHACSAAYLLASAATGSVIPKTGLAGSVGVIMLHVDYSKALDKAGVNITPIFSGARKNDYSPYEALGEDVYKKAVAEADTVRDMFVEAVARYRNGRVTADALRNTEAETFMGADAVKMGLIDEVGDPILAANTFIAEIGRQAA